MTMPQDDPSQGETPSENAEGVPGLDEAIAQSSYELLRGLVGRIVHDFNNYLAAIGGNIELALLEVGEESKAGRLLTFAQQATRKANNLASQLSNLSENGLPVHRGDSLSDFVRDSVCFVLSGSKIACEFDLPQDLNEVQLDERDIGRIIQEAVINASRDMSGGGVLSVRGSNVPPEGEEPGAECWVKFEFGYSPSKEEADSDEPTGTVKGSTVRFLRWETVRTIVEENGGEFTLAEEPGNATQLVIFLPAIPKVPPESNGLPTKTSLEGRRVLLMEDETLVLGLTRNMLEELGCDVLISRDGAEAVETYRRAMREARRVDVAILDLTVPGGMGGEEAATEILKEDPEARLVISSGFVNERTPAHYRQLGFKGVLRKPFRLSELEELLRKVVE